MVNEIEASFPKLRRSTYRVTSPRTREYNCIAWAATDVSRWWWPDDDPSDDVPYWPPGVAREETLPAFRAAFASLGYVPCATEEGFEKVALFTDAARVPTHAARQLANEHWTSKLGFLEDIEHKLHDLEGATYGVVTQILRREIAESTS